MRWVLLMIVSVLATAAARPSVADILTPPPNMCLSLTDLEAQVRGRYPMLDFATYDGQQSHAITEGMVRSGAALLINKKHIYIIGSQPGNLNVILMGFADGCYEGARIIPAELLRDWLNGTTTNL